MGKRDDGRATVSAAVPELTLLQQSEKIRQYMYTHIFE
jgi:hypothetical protein